MVRRLLFQAAIRATLVAATTLSPAALVAQRALPAPRGPLHVGTTIRHLVDSSRADLLSGKAPRELVVQLWYPTRDTRGTRTLYVTPAVLKSMLASGYLRLDSATIAGWGGLQTDAIADAPIAGRDLPVLVFSHGLGISRSLYSALLEELASRGYLVAAIDHPYGGVMERADGRVITLEQDTASGAQDSLLAVRATEWARDASFVLDQLRDAHSSLGNLVAGRASERGIGMLGHSLGGAAALDACQADVRFRACADLDGMVVGRAASEGPRGATLIMRSGPEPSDADLAKGGRTRAQWDAMGREVEAHFRGVAAKGTPGDVTLLRFRGAAHMSFSDAPFTFPYAITRFGGAPMDPTRAFTLVSSAVRDFFDRELRGASRSALATLAARSPELVIEVQ